jgi:hypothetical protein
MKTIIKSLKLSVLAAAMASFITSAQAWTYSASGQYASKTYGSWTVYQDEWGSTASCILYANSAGNFASAGSWTGSGTKGYPHTQSNVDVPISSSHSCTASFNYSAPNNPWWCFFYDTWTASMQDELMIQEGWNGTGNWGTKIASNVSIAGRTIASVWQANNGQNNVLVFTPASQRSSGSDDIMAYFIWSLNKGVLHNSTLHQLSFGVEPTYTSGWQQFTVNSFSSSWK